MRPAEESAEITLRGLITARWVLLGLLSVVGLIGSMDALAPRLDWPLTSWFPALPKPRPFAITLAIWAGLNVVTTRWFVGSGRATSAVAGAHLLVDATALTALLAISGGATNPFTTLYFVPITLATQVSPRWTWSLAGFSLAGFATLFLLEPLPQGPPGHEEHFAGHLRGMWVAFGFSGVLVTYFVHRIALSLARQRDELTRLRDAALQDRHLASIGSLAAGAAHELGTPLGTIRLLVSELPHLGPDERDEAIATIKGELSRCKTIVHRMATPEARVTTMAKDAPAWSLASLADELDAGQDVAIEVEIPPEARQATVGHPREALAQILRELVHNAVDACRRRPGSRGVAVRIEVEGSSGRITVSDDGVGMPEAVAAAAFDPFFSTKPEGEGMGLGLYLARAQLRQLGGEITLASAPSRGTTLVLRFPLRGRA